MLTYKLTVTEMAEVAGVSKSAMEKYLAGPSSPRATAIASPCAGLGINSEWLIFGQADDDLRRIRDIGTHSIYALLQELKQAGSLAGSFQSLKLGSKEWRSFALKVGAKRAAELSKLVAENRKKERSMAVDGMRLVAVGPFPLCTLTDEEF